MKSILVIYHRADFDGRFCCEIARRFYGEQADYLGWDYGDPVPEVPVEVKELIMLDISIPYLMDDGRLTWIDHHITAMQRFAAPGYRIEGVAACRLAWQWFMTHNIGRNPSAPTYATLPTFQDYRDRKVQEPLAVRLAGEYDIWDKRDPDAETWQHALHSVEDLTPLWPTLLALGDSNMVVQALLKDGRMLQRCRQRENASLIKARGFRLEWEGHVWLALNTPRCNSLTFEAGLTPEHDGCFAFCWTGTKWRVSLYGVPGKPEMDFSGIAARYGGGGHRQACGFETKALPFLQPA